MTGVNYDSDDARNFSPPLKPKHPDYSLRESPVPFLSDNSQSPESKPCPAGPDCKRPHHHHHHHHQHHHNHHHHRRRRNPNSSLSAKQILMSLGADQPNLLNEIVDGPFLSQSSSSSDAEGSEWESSTESGNNNKAQDMSSQGTGSATTTKPVQHGLRLIGTRQGDPASSSPTSKSTSINNIKESQDDDKSFCRMDLSSSPFASFDPSTSSPGKRSRSAIESESSQAHARALPCTALPPISTHYAEGSRTIATSPKLRPFAISPSRHLATLPAMQSPPHSATSNSPGTSLPPLKKQFPDELAESRVKDQSVRMSGASPLHPPASSSPQSRSSLELAASRPDQQQQQQQQSLPPPPQPHQQHPGVAAQPPPPSNSYMRLSPAHPPQDIPSLASTPSTAPSQPSPFHTHSKSDRSFTLSCEATSQAGDTPGTNYSTPIEPQHADITEQNPRRDEQPSSSTSHPTGTYRCTHAGCTAPPFQTQYLLNSHANVHSQDRPFFCPVSDCPHSEGGKGFKRKNEMIRHGLVHDSPGYVCPFCHDQQHTYPRPDNLQRHVRVHHIDRDKDDPLLRRVLSQRPTGLKRGRKRRS